MSVDIIKKCREGHPLIMGVVNVTPDSFSDGGSYLQAEKAIAHGLALLDAGADVLDIGGESTRPNSKTITVEEEIVRVIPVIGGLTGKTPFISIDTRNAHTMAAAIKAGANMVNDISALTHDEDSVHIIADNKLPICLMHMKGNPQNMQNAPTYDNVVDELLVYFEERIEFCARNNVDLDKIVIDPGIGFGKTLEHNLQILSNLNEFKVFGCPVLLGASRKSFIGKLCYEPDASRRIYGSIAAAIQGLNKGASIFRVHDVKETRQAFDVYQAIK